VVFAEDASDLKWAKNFGGSNTDYFYSVVETNDKGLVVAGNSNSTDIEGLTDLGYYDAIIVKYDSSGNKVWAKNFGDSYYDEFYSVVETSDGGLVVVGCSSSSNVSGLTNLGDNDAIIVKFKESEEKAVVKAESNSTLQNISRARILINTMSESIEKDQLQARLNSLTPSDLALIPENNTSNIDVYVLSNNSLSLSLLNSLVTFDDFSGTEDLSISNALSFTVDSSLNYNISISLVGNIVSNKGNVLDKSIFNLKANDSSVYSNYINSNTLNLFTNQTAGNNKTHKIDMMLKGNVAHTADVYKAVLKISVEQV
jgi:hypothetical protein